MLPVFDSETTQTKWAKNSGNRGLEQGNRSLARQAATVVEGNGGRSGNSMSYEMWQTKVSITMTNPRWHWPRISVQFGLLLPLAAISVIFVVAIPAMTLVCCWHLCIDDCLSFGAGRRAVGMSVSDAAAADDIASGTGFLLRHRRARRLRAGIDRAIFRCGEHWCVVNFVPSRFGFW